MNQAPTAPAPELYLIAHKVRGEPAFDIACRVQLGNEEGWIIPTSGHRAYPWWEIKLSDLQFEEYNRDAHGMVPVVMDIVPLPPPDWPDHYSTIRERPIPLAERLGIKRAPPPTVTRRL